MGGIVDLIFGGSDDSAQQGQNQANAAQIALARELAQQARGDVTRIIPIADENRNLGFQAALDVFGQGTGQQLDVFQQGNVGAQQAALAGVPQFQNAILGRPTDLSGLQPQQLDFDPSFLNQILPDFFTGVTDQTGTGAGGDTIPGGAGGAAGGLGGSGSSNFQNNIAAFIDQNTPDNTSGGVSAGEMSPADAANAFGGMGLGSGLFGGSLASLAMPNLTGLAMDAFAQADLGRVQQAFQAMSPAQQIASMHNMTPSGLAALGLNPPPGYNPQAAIDRSNLQFAQSSAQAAASTGAGGGDQGFGGIGNNGGHDPGIGFGGGDDGGANPGDPSNPF